MDPQQQRTGAPQRGPPQTGDSSPILTVLLFFLAILALVISPSPDLNLFQRLVYVCVRRQSLECFLSLAKYSFLINPVSVLF